MKFIESTADMIKEENPFKQIERIGRTCYKSEDKITDTSCYKFVQGMINRQHFAMLEHGRVVFRLKQNTTYGELLPLSLSPDVSIIFDPNEEGTAGALIAVSLSHLYNTRYAHIGEFDMMREVFRSYIARNYNIEIQDIPQVSDVYKKEMEQSEDSYRLQGNLFFDIVEEDRVPLLIRSYSVKFICDRGVSHELVRHRVSAAQESTRYCNYTKEKFGGDITFVYPSNYDNWTDESQDIFLNSCENSEINYKLLIEKGHTPQEARAVLSNSLKTECILTMKLYQWIHFFDMRYRGTTGAPHPDMVRVARIAHQLFKEKEHLDL